MIKGKSSTILIFSYFLLIIFLNILSCSNSPDKGNVTNDTKSISAIGYDLNNPDERIILPSVLHEISGITAIDSSTIACVQDEVGIIFFYDVRNKTVTQHITFYGNGDYEGITRTNGTFYVMKSNGTLYEVADLEPNKAAREIRLEGMPHHDIEGLCFDRKNNRLLIAPKDKTDKDSKAEAKQGLYGFDLATGELIKDPFIEFRLSTIKDFAVSNKVFGPVEFNKKGEPKKPDIRFSPSAIALHPITGKLYLLSADDHMLFVFDLEGKIEYMVRLKPDLFNMPEGITFFRNGAMLISNEGQNGNATLLRFKYQQ